MSKYTRSLLTNPKYTKAELRAIFRKLSKNSVKLTSLSLIDIEFTSREVKFLIEALANNTNLLSLNLSNNKIDSNGAIALALFLSNNKTLTNLNLSGNIIDDEGAQALSDAIKVNLYLVKLDLSRNKIEENGIKSLWRAINFNDFISEVKLENNPGYNTIDSSVKTNIATKLKQNSAKPIPKKITQSNKKDPIANVEIDQLKTESKDKPQDVRLEDEKERWDNVSEEQRNRLEIAALEWEKEQEEETEEQKTLLEQEKAQVKELKNKWQLKKQLLSQNILDLSFNQLDKDLNLFEISESIKKEDSKIITLNLSNNYIGDEKVKILASALQINKTLKKLDLFNCGITIDGAIAILEALKVNNNLIEIDLRANQIPQKLLQDIESQLTKNEEMQDQKKTKESDQPSQSTKVISQTPLRILIQSR